MIRHTVFTLKNSWLCSIYYRPIWTNQNILPFMCYLHNLCWKSKPLYKRWGKLLFEPVKSNILLCLLYVQPCVKFYGVMWLPIMVIVRRKAIDRPIVYTIFVSHDCQHIMSWSETLINTTSYSFIAHNALFDRDYLFSWYGMRRFLIPTSDQGTSLGKLSPIYVDADNEWRMPSPGGSQWNLKIE